MNAIWKTLLAALLLLGVSTLESLSGGVKVLRVTVDGRKYALHTMDKPLDEPHVAYTVFHDIQTFGRNSQPRFGWFRKTNLGNGKMAYSWMENAKFENDARVEANWRQAKDVRDAFDKIWEEFHRPKLKK